MVAAGKAKEEAEKQRAARAEQEQQALGAQAAAKAEMLKRALTGSKAGEQRDFEIAPGVKITMCWIPPGEFMMGSPAGEAEPYAKENQHRVTLTQGFWLAQTETTQAQWYAVMGAVVRENRSAFKGGNIPVESVSWNDVAGPGGFIDKVNKTAEGEDRFALPTEAQWEYACRAGTTGPYAGYLNQMAWYDKNSGIKTHPTAGKKANDWGLHDMHGNVWEWCADWYGVYPDGAAKDPKGSPFGIGRVSRGGSWNGSARNCRAASRNYFSSSGTYNYVGFRIARGLVP